MSQLPVSVAILAEHMDAKLAACVASVNWAAEMVIGWNGPQSIPEVTVWIHKQLQHAQLQHAHLQIVTLPDEITDFSQTRNLVQAHAQYPWVFWLDSDEVFPSACVSELATLIADEQLGGIFIRRQDVFAGRTLRWGEVRNVRLLRIFRRDTGRFERPIHEVAAVPGRLVSSKIIVQHFAHDSIAHFFQKIIRYSHQEALFRYAHHQSSTMFELILWPIGKFLQNVFLRWAFLDGWQGMTYAVMMSLHSLAVRAQVIELNHKDLATSPDNHV